MKSSHGPRRDSPTRSVAATLLVGLVVVAGGCRSELDTTYGMRSGYGAESVNGTAVLAELFEQAGHWVTNRTAISPSFENATVIVWAPDRFDCPAPATVAWLERWLRARPDRCLIYIGRDFDAAPAYWRQILVEAGDPPPPDVAAELARAQREFQRERGIISGTSTCDWFTLDYTTGSRPVTTLEGPFSEGIDPKQVDFTLHSRVTSKPDWPYEVLLESEGDLIAGVHTLDAAGGESRMIVVANGSFLLNVPLVNREHRKLAGKLVDSLPEGEQRIIFLESGPDEVYIRDEEDLGGPPSVLSMLGVWPLSVIVGHLVVLGIVFAIGRWPIFGQPRHLPPVVRSEFGQHVEAVGNLMAKTKSPDYARHAIALLHQVLNGEKD